MFLRPSSVLSWVALGDLGELWILPSSQFIFLSIHQLHTLSDEENSSLYRYSSPFLALAKPARKLRKSLWTHARTMPLHLPLPCFSILATQRFPLQFLLQPFSILATQRFPATFLSLPILFSSQDSVHFLQYNNYISYPSVFPPIYTSYSYVASSVPASQIRTPADWHWERLVCIDRIIDQCIQRGSLCLKIKLNHIATAQSGEQLDWKAPLAWRLSLVVCS